MSAGFISDLSGWVSIGCWLFAQFPQVLENIKRQSCEGLALPFLFNWLLGDITNLIGCLLTRQLPFQTILATYFVFVDLTLFSQYFYYGRLTTKLEAAGELPSSPVQRYTSRAGGASVEHERRYRELSNAAANVAIAAALAAASEEELLVHTKDNVKRSHPRRSSTSITRSEAAEAEDEVDEDVLAALADSFHSESGRKRVSWSQERYGSGRIGSASRTRRSTVPPLTPMVRTLSTDAVENATSGMNARGRPLQRQIVDSPIDIPDLEGNLATARRSLSSVATARRNSRASQRSAGLVFLGVWALFGIGTLSQRSNSVSSPHGVVLSEVPQPTPLYPVQDTNLYSSKPFEGPISIGSMLAQMTRSQPEEPSSERVIGRLFAWSCTTLYLTSRLPQIWKNFVRKSVEGLSMYLFVFAFLGNTFYVLSILSSPMMSKPRPISTAFLLESMPYLLGSAGTLLFDVTIVSQSFLYRTRPGHHHVHIHQHVHPHQHQHHHNSSSYSRSRRNPYHQKSSSEYGSMDFVTEEEQALLRSPDIARDLERGASCDQVHEHEWPPQHHPATGPARRRKDANDEDHNQPLLP